MLGLGCENSNIPVLKDYLGDTDEKRVKFLISQEVDDEIEKGISLIEEIIENIADESRKEIDASELIIGMKCGGSDGLSGITANPIVGEFSDILISKGGSTILTENRRYTVAGGLFRTLRPAANVRRTCRTWLGFRDCSALRWLHLSL